MSCSCIIGIGLWSLRPYVQINCLSKKFLQGVLSKYSQSVTATTAIQICGPGGVGPLKNQISDRAFAQPNPTHEKILTIDVIQTKIIII